MWRLQQSPWKHCGGDDDDKVQAIWQFEGTTDISSSAEKKTKIMKIKQSIERPRAWRGKFIYGLIKNTVSIAGYVAHTGGIIYK
jgi:hypothetical protein